jgi:hypothetical protein
MENASRKLPPMQKTGSNRHRRCRSRSEKGKRRGQTEAMSNASPFREIRPAYPAPAVGGALTDFSADDKFVKELAEAIPLGEVTVLYLEGK